MWVNITVDENHRLIIRILRQDTMVPKFLSLIFNEKMELNYFLCVFLLDLSVW